MSLDVDGDPSLWWRRILKETMTQEPDASERLESQEWWQAVRSIADLVSRDGHAPDEERVLRRELTVRGFSKDGIGKALDWVGMAALSGNLMDTLGMLQPSSDAIRVEHPLEKLSLGPGLTRAVDVCRRQGVLSSEMAERLIEGLRTMDTRDWEQEDIESFFAEVLAVSVPGLAGVVVSKILSGKARSEYN